VPRFYGFLRPSKTAGKAAARSRFAYPRSFGAGCSGRSLLCAWLFSGTDLGNRCQRAASLLGAIQTEFPCSGGMHGVPRKVFLASLARQQGWTAGDGWMFQRDRKCMKSCWARLAPRRPGAQAL